MPIVLLYICIEWDTVVKSLVNIKHVLTITGKCNQSGKKKEETMNEVIGYI